MAEPTLQSINNAISQLKKTVASVQNDIKDIQDTLGIYARKSDVNVVKNGLEEDLTSANASIAEISVKLQKVCLPSETRYYLTESEITSFRNNFRQLRAMTAEVERSRQAMIKILARYNLTNSSL